MAAIAFAQTFAEKMCNLLSVRRIIAILQFVTICEIAYMFIVYCKGGAQTFRKPFMII